MYHNFSATQSLKLKVPPASLPIQTYLKKPQRIVNLLATQNPMEYLTSNTYRLKMRPVQFFSLKMQPTVDLKIWGDDTGTLYLKSLGSELRGIASLNEHFNLQVSGKMHPHQLGESTYLQGYAELSLKIYLPPPFTLMPETVLQSSGSRLLASILRKMKQELMEKLLQDYSQWVVTELENWQAA